jgi:hypothetical protein
MSERTRLRGKRSGCFGFALHRAVARMSGVPRYFSAVQSEQTTIFTLFRLPQQEQKNSNGLNTITVDPSKWQSQVKHERCP